MAFERPEIIRPPSEHASYYLPLTSGCSNNTCGFCAYSFTSLGVRDLEDVKGEIDAMSLYTHAVVHVKGHSVNFLLDLFQVPDSQGRERIGTEGARVVGAARSERQVIAGMLAGGP
jgi:hypothetical protein